MLEPQRPKAQLRIRRTKVSVKSAITPPGSVLAITQPSTNHKTHLHRPVAAAAGDQPRTQKASHHDRHHKNHWCRTAGRSQRRCHTGEGGARSAPPATPARQPAPAHLSPPQPQPGPHGPRADPPQTTPHRPAGGPPGATGDAFALDQPRHTAFPNLFPTSVKGWECFSPAESTLFPTFPTFPTFFVVTHTQARACKAMPEKGWEGWEGWEAP